MLPSTIDRAEKAKEKKALYGEDIDLEQFIKEEAGEHEQVSRANEVPRKVQETLLKVGVSRSQRRRKIRYLCPGRPEWSVYYLCI
jgi:hypothetical protein